MSNTKVYTHYGPWTSNSRSNPTLAFFESYTNLIATLSLSDHSYHDFYAPSATFTDTDGSVYTGGQTIWDWIHELFGPFKKLGAEGERRVIVLEGMGVVGNGGEVDGERTRKKLRGDVVFYEHTMVFYLKGSEEDEETVSARRMMEFVIGPAEEEGQGTGGMQIWKGKVWWDKSAVMAEARRRGGG